LWAGTGQWMRRTMEMMTMKGEAWDWILSLAIVGLLLAFIAGCGSMAQRTLNTVVPPAPATIGTPAHGPDAAAPGGSLGIAPAPVVIRP
jgi:hypothetical protein